MNHSCRPTCGVEFDFAARILVLQQPYVDIQKGAGVPGSLGAWEPGSCLASALPEAQS